MGCVDGRETARESWTEEVADVWAVCGRVTTEAEDEDEDDDDEDDDDEDDDSTPIEVDEG